MQVAFVARNPHIHATYFSFFVNAHFVITSERICNGMPENTVSINNYGSASLSGQNFRKPNRGILQPNIIPKISWPRRDVNSSTNFQLSVNPSNVRGILTSNFSSRETSLRVRTSRNASWYLAFS